MVFIQYQNSSAILLVIDAKEKLKDYLERENLKYKLIAKQAKDTPYKKKQISLTDKLTIIGLIITFITLLISLL